MPKKTKKQKYLSDIRREKIIENQISYGFVKSQIQDQLASIKHENPDLKMDSSKASVKPKSTILAVDPTLVKKDLIKITLFTISAIIIQGVLYYLLRMR